MADRDEARRGCAVAGKPSAISCEFRSLPAIIAGTDVYDLCAGNLVDAEQVDHLYNYRMSDRLQDLSVFVRAAETGSFSRVAREFGISQPSVSRTVARLEARV